MREPPLSYRAAGVDIDAGDELVERIRPYARRTLRPEVIGDLGGFAGLCALPAGYRDPVLVSGTDGVGTKVLVAIEAGVHDTIGVDLVAMCANDVVVCGAEPLFFLDYFATGKLDVAVAEAVMRGVARGCELAGCALIGGETAEMPGLYRAGEYDLAGFCVGVVERDAILDGSRIAAGDVVLGLASSGFHANGYALVRRALLGPTSRLRLSLDDPVLREELLRPTRIYVRAVRAAAAAAPLRGCAHITGGGLVDNPPRILPHGLRMRLFEGSWPVPALMRRLHEEAGVPWPEMRRTFNLGIGMVLVLPAAAAAAARAACEAEGEVVYEIGRIEEGSGPPEVIFS
ncbi:MAG: phosphoribosylformylglycinamidine cyclo-ligase [Myxococcales bacterium]|nr:phosphoribosylformylglycinamidine cyclo-ligase [Myxococcota bacterium]MDW8280787.1 phosphoribosylformylglycinamidine cyclo-ligase [Myxococcales bacterium]